MIWIYGTKVLHNYSETSILIPNERKKSNWLEMDLTSRGGKIEKRKKRKVK